MLIKRNDISKTINTIQKYVIYHLLNYSSLLEAFWLEPSLEHARKLH